jgi:hypothetical protein
MIEIQLLKEYLVMKEVRRSSGSLFLFTGPNPDIKHLGGILIGQLT